MLMPKKPDGKPRLASVSGSEPVAPPHAVEAEQALLGVLLLVPERLPEVAGLVQLADFYNDGHRRIWRHLSEMAEAGESIDALTVSDRIAQWNEVDQTGGMSYLLELCAPATPSAKIDAYARLIADRAQRRRLLERVRDIEQLAHSAGAGTGAERIAKAAQLLADLSVSTPLPGPAESLLGVEPARALDGDMVFADELVEDVLTLHGVSVVYGASNSGKTFFAIDLAAAVARGVKWQEKCTTKAGVLYLATESPAGVRQRIAAYMKHHDLDMLDVFVAAKPINLFESDADISRVVSEIAHIKAMYGVDIKLIIGDTMARIAAGANENAGEDMGVVMAHADRMCRETQCAFMWIHHSGKDEAKGARGWSGIRAHIDTEIEVKDADENGVHTAEITKQRDLGGKGTRFGFRLQVMRLGMNKWGNVRTTCIVVPENAPEKPKGGKPNEADPAILVFLGQKGAGARAGDIVDGLEGVLSRRAIYNGLRRLKDAGKLDCVSGIYAIRSH